MSQFEDLKCHCPQHGDWIHTPDLGLDMQRIKSALYGKNSKLMRNSLSDIAAHLESVQRRTGKPLLGKN